MRACVRIRVCVHAGVCGCVRARTFIWVVLRTCGRPRTNLYFSAPQSFANNNNNNKIIVIVNYKPIKTFYCHIYCVDESKKPTISMTEPPVFIYND